MKIFEVKYIVLFALLVSGFSCNSSNKEGLAASEGRDEANAWTVTVRGKVGFPQQGDIYIQELKDGQTIGWQDTIRLKSNYTYAKKVKMTQPGYYRINFYNKQAVTLILDKADLEVNVDGNNPQGFYEIKGSPDIDLINQVQNLLASANNAPEMNQINQDYTAAAQRQDREAIAKLQQQYQGILGRYHDQVAALLEQKAPSLAVINLLQSNTIDKDKYYKTYVTVADKVKKEWPNYPIGKNFVDYVEKMKATSIGQPAPEIALPNPNGEIVKLSSMKGKYVLVDFWAKWCGPCRQENPNVVRVFNKYKDKGFTVFGVSLDRNKEDWLQAIEADGLTWTHVSDLKFWQSEAAKLYNVSAIPFSLLVDPNGVIIAKNLRGAELESRLAEIFEKK